MFTAPTTSPDSTRYTPSRVSPVSSSVCGSTWRMYHRQVSSSPRSVEAIIDASDFDPPGAVMIRLSTAGVTATPAVPAENRLECSADSTPAESHGSRPAGSPLSNTDESRPEECATTNGAHSSPR